MAKRIRKRDDTDPAEGERAYGDVEFADPVNNKYPIDSEEHVRAAWSYINKKANAATYSADEVDRIKGRIRKAAGRYDIDQRGLSATSRLSARPLDHRAGRHVLARARTVGSRTTLSWRCSVP
jgi:hypothetical protein